MFFIKVLIISPGYHSVTGEHGGAIENLINIFLKYNEGIKDSDEIVVYSAKIDGEVCDKQIYKNTTFRVIDMSTFNRKIKQKIFNRLKKMRVIDVRRIYYRYVIKDIVKKKESQKYDVIIFENGLENICYFRKKIKTNSKVVLHLHNDYLNVESEKSKKILKLFDEVWTVSKFLKKRVDEIDNGKSNVKVLYNTIEFDKFKRCLSEDEKTNIKKELSINKQDFVFIYVGRIMEEKGTLELVHAFNKLNEKYNATKLIVIGGNKSLKNEGYYYDLVKKEACDSVIFTGTIDNNQLYKYYSCSDAQVIPSVCNEAFGLIVLEGMASNVVVIATKTGGIPEIIKNENLLVEKDDLTNNLFNKMEYIYICREKKNDFIRDYSDIMDDFSTENYCKRFKCLLKENR